MRDAGLERATKETRISVALRLDGAAECRVATGLRMLDHLLEQWVFHSRASVRIEAESLDGIVHHLVEDVAIALGKALDASLDDRRGIGRYGNATIPMDDALVRAVVDFGGRGYARTHLPLSAETIEGLSAVLVPHFFSSFAQNARIALHVDRLAGNDPHHLVEAAFKALARACRQAWSLETDLASLVLSTKGVM